MHTLFQKAVLSTIDEFGEELLAYLIRDFLAVEKRQNFEYSNPSTYYISDAEFDELRNQVKALFDRFDLGLYKEANAKSKKEEDSSLLLNREETNKILDDKANWIYKKELPIYLLKVKNDYDQIPNYLDKVFDKKIRKHIDQIRRRYDNKMEVIPPFGKGGLESVIKIINKTISKKARKETRYAGLSVAFYNDGNISYVYSQYDAGFWTIIKNPRK